MIIEENFKDFKDRERMNRDKNKKNEQVVKDNVVNFEAKNYQIKENSFFILTTKNETYFLVVENINKIAKE